MEEPKTVIFDTGLAPNGQVTVKKTVREELELEAGDTIWLQVVRVVNKNGVDKFPAPEPIISGGQE